MRPNNKGEYDSLYFDYPEFEAPVDLSVNDLSKRTQVAIVGAGPVGMTAALTLAKHGIPSVILEKGSTFNDGSRAICIARQSFHILESIDALQPFLNKALGWTKGRSFYRGKQILEFEMPDSPDDKFRPMYNLQQQYIEQYLWQAVAQNPLIDLRWQSEVVDLSETDEGVALTIKDANNEYVLPAEWLLAADGARSVIRTLRGLRLNGDNYVGRYVIADVKMDHDYPTIRRALFDPNCRRGGTVLIHRQPDDIWRIDYQLRDDENSEEAIKEEVVRESVRGVLAEIGHTGDWELEWWSVYSANTLALDDYRDGRVIFIGDSAHIVPIFGVRGLNNGLADGQNIGWKLAYFLKGHAGEKLIDTYSQERRGATLGVFAQASKSTRFMTPPTRGWQIMRDAALSLAVTKSYAGELADPRQMVPHSYRDSPITQKAGAAPKNGPALGEVATNVRLESGFLSDQLGSGFTVLLFGSDMITEDLKNSLAPLAEVVSIVQLPLDSPAAKAYSATEGSVYVIRPDMHICARDQDLNPNQILALIQNTLCLEE